MNMTTDLVMSIHVNKDMDTEDADTDTEDSDTDTEDADMDMGTDTDTDIDSTLGFSDIGKTFNLISDIMSESAPVGSILEVRYWAQSDIVRHDIRLVPTCVN
jgi:hypothetical protein